MTDAHPDSGRPDLRCYHHPDTTATNQCDRCEDMLCNDCVNEYLLQRLCPECMERIRRPYAWPVRFITGIMALANTATAAMSLYFIALSFRPVDGRFILPAAGSFGLLIFQFVVLSTMTFRTVRRHGEILSRPLTIAACGSCITALALAAVAVVITLIGWNAP